MTYRTEFPDFDPATLPAIPEGWTDVSWNNDACPSFAFFDEDEGDSNYSMARVWIDYETIADREMGGGKRFAITYEGGPDVFTALETDDWNEVLAYVAARQELAAQYVEAVGNNPFLDDPQQTPEAIAETLTELAPLAKEADS